VKNKLIAELYMFNKDRYCERFIVNKFAPRLVITFVNPMKVEWYEENEPLPLPDYDSRVREFAKHLRRLVFVMFDSPRKEKGQIVQKYILEEIE